MVGVVNPNMAAHARYTGDADGETYYSYIDTNGAYTTPDGIFSHRTEDWNTKTKDTYIKNAWNSVNLKFSSGDNEKLALVVIFEYANVYVDDFSLTSKTSSNTSSTTTSSVPSTTSSATTTSSVTSTTTSTTSSTTSTTTSSTPEPTPVFDSYFETPSSWAIYTNLSTHVNSEKGTLSSWGKAVANTDKAFVAEGNGSVILNAQWQKSSVEFEVEKGKNYAFSFKYYSTNTTAPLSSIGVLNSDLAAEGRNAANETYYSFIDKYGSFTTTDGIYSNRTENWDIKTGTNYVANDWNDISIIFNSGENTSLTLVVIFEVAGIYMDSFSLSEYTPPPVPETEASYWQVYLNSTDIVDGNGSNRANKSWNKVTDNKTDVQYGDMASVMGYGSHITIIRLLGELEVNQDYKISFAYYSDETNVTYSDSLFSQQGILTKGTELGQGGGAYPKSVYYAADPCAGEQGKWHKYEFSFTNWDNTEKYFYCVPVFEGGAKKFYVADFKIEKTTLEKKTPRPFTGWGDEPKEEYLINFDDFLVPFTESVVEISEGPARDGKTSNTMHILPIESQTSIFPRYQSIKNYTDSIFTLNVKPNTLYEYSFWIFIHEKAENIPWLQFFYDYSGNDTYILLNKTKDKGRWVKYSAKFTTKADQTKISIGVNLGETIREMWIDEFRIKEVPAGVLVGDNTRSYCVDDQNITVKSKAFGTIEGSKSGVYKFSLTPSAQYSFGISVKSSKTSSSRVFLSYDGVNPIMPSDEGAECGEIRSLTQNMRYCFNFVSNSTGELYLVVENNDNALKLSEPALFKTTTLSTGRFAGSDAPISRSLSANKGKENLKDLSTEGLVMLEDESYAPAFGNGVNGNVSVDGSPATGDTLLPLTFLIITFVSATVLILLTRKGGEQA